MTKNKLTLAGALASLIGTSSMVSAQADTPTINTGTQIVSAFAGAQWFDIADQIDEIGDSVENELNLGARYQYNFTPHIGLEGNFMYSPAQHEFFGPEGAGIGSADVDAYYYGGNFVYNISPASRVIPFLTAGAGAVTLRVDEDAPETSELSSSETKFAVNFGGGLLFAFNENFALRFEARDYMYRVEELDPQFRFAFNVPAGFEETVHDISLTGGFSFIF
jgi:outer membrane beta-barrel protein